MVIRINMSEQFTELIKPKAQTNTISELSF